MAHVKRIRYLDFRLVDDGVLSHAREQYQGKHGVSVVMISVCVLYDMYHVG